MSPAPNGRCEAIRGAGGRRLHGLGSERRPARERSTGVRSEDRANAWGLHDTHNVEERVESGVGRLSEDGLSAPRPRVRDGLFAGRRIVRGPRVGRAAGRGREVPHAGAGGVSCQSGDRGAALGTRRAGSWRPGGDIETEVTVPKRRLVSAAPFRDRVAHHAVHVYRYFPAIDHTIRKATVRRRVACRRTLAMLDRIIAGPPDADQHHDRKRMPLTKTGTIRCSAVPVSMGRHPDVGAGGELDPAAGGAGREPPAGAAADVARPARDHQHRLDRPLEPVDTAREPVDPASVRPSPDRRQHGRHRHRAAGPFQGPAPFGCRGYQPDFARRGDARPAQVAFADPEQLRPRETR